MRDQHRMCGAAATLVLALTLAVGVTSTGAATSVGASTVRVGAIAWLVPQVTDEGALISSYTDAPDPSLTAQAVLGLAGSGVEPAVVDRMIGYLEANVEQFVAPGGSDDLPGSLAWLILDAVATDGDPTNFGGVDLVARLQATPQATGLFGTSDATYDGVFRQSLSLIALSAVGETNVSGLSWLLDQQCADGGFVAFRADTSEPCPAVDPATFSGPDTNSTAMAAIALHAFGADAEAGRAIDWLQGVRTSDGGFAYLGDASSLQDANSTGLAALAFRTLLGTDDAQSVAALASLQVGSGDPSDVGGIAFQTGDPLTPDLMATTQALLGLAGQGFPFRPVETPSTSTSVPSQTTTPSRSATAATPVSAKPAYTG